MATAASYTTPAEAPPPAASSIGIDEVVKKWYLSSVLDSNKGGDATGVVDVRLLGEMRRPVELRHIKVEDDAMKGFALLKQPRLSVVPVLEGIWEPDDPAKGGAGEDAQVRQFVSKT
ncbi:hypothetical protein ZIOFF_028472 [Zingiber officinale]|uniref:EVE domain-containing protein n=1 Tax=Zingiber officinale TaxID=94328 RepID=A0A8J5H6B3_ZINOF|nr:hypothetical protein ZIOFF_028472 [Zingiber officinale]